jgi:hypothetical protein
MIGSPARTCRWIAVVCGVAVLGAGAVPSSSRGIAAEISPWRSNQIAQQIGPPVKLAPILQPPSVERAPAPAPAPEPSPPATSGAQEQGRNAVRVEVDALTAIDRDSVGLLDESQGGFGVSLWQGTDRSLVERLMPGLTPVASSRFVRRLMIRLLLSRATAPKGNSNGQGLLALRVDRLAAAGDMKSAVGLLRVSPGGSDNEILARTEIEGLFFQNDNAGACAKLRGQISRHKGLYWQQANAFCLALSGENAKSAMIADILRERETDVGPEFFMLVDALAGDKGVLVESLKEPNGLQLSMMRAANLKLPGDIIQSRQPAVLRAVALSPNAEFETRLEAAERAMMIGALSPGELGEIYRAAQFTPEQLADPLAAATNISAPMARALLLRDAEARRQPTATAEALRRAWESARERGGRDILLRASLPVLRSIDPAPELMWFAKDAAAGLFLAGEIERAMAWYALARQQSSANDEARAAIVALWPLVMLVDGGADEWNPESLDAWLNMIQSKSGDVARSTALTIFSLFESLGRPIEPERWAKLVDAAPSINADIPDAALRFALRNASDSKRVGETVLMSLLALGDKAIAGMNPMTVTTVITALRRVGLDTEARALALEVAVGAGL